MKSPPRYWFPAKKYGWGWSAPRIWEGWTVLAVYVCLLLAGAFAFPPARDVAAFLAMVAALTLVLLAVCWLKGEPPRWRWGEEEKD